MRVTYERVTELDEVLDTDDETLARGVGQVFDLLTVAAPAIEVLGFATNSRRRLALLPEGGTMRVVYLALAGKPLRTSGGHAARRHSPCRGAPEGRRPHTASRRHFGRTVLGGGVPTR